MEQGGYELINYCTEGLQLLQAAIPHSTSDLTSLMTKENQAMEKLWKGLGEKLHGNLTSSSWKGLETQTHL